MLYDCAQLEVKFQTKLTYGMICYYVMQRPVYIGGFKFQTKLTYGMICYSDYAMQRPVYIGFQTKLTYGMICYKIKG